MADLNLVVHSQNTISRQVGDSIWRQVDHLVIAPNWIFFFDLKYTLNRLNQIRVNSPRDIYNGEHETTLVIDFITTDSPLETNKPAVLENINSKENISYDNFEQFYVNKSIIISNITDHNSDIEQYRIDI